LLTGNRALYCKVYFDWTTRSKQIQNERVNDCVQFERAKKDAYLNNRQFEQNKMDLSAQNVTYLLQCWYQHTFSNSNSETCSSCARLVVSFEVFSPGFCIVSCLERSLFVEQPQHERKYNGAINGGIQ
jgi:hypothetical protein